MLIHLVHRVQFGDDGIRFTGYPFAPASVYPAGLLGYDLVEDVDPLTTPPEVRTRSGEVLFVPANQRHLLEAGAGAHGLAMGRRVDVWALILEPFLDTEIDAAGRERTLSLLEANGVGRQECTGLREEVSDAMTRYNLESGLWDWAHLGLFDLLSAQSALMAGEAFHAFYGQAMEIAARGRRI